MRKTLVSLVVGLTSLASSLNANHDFVPEYQGKRPERAELVK